LRNYELLCILKTGFDIENAEHIVTNLENAIRNIEGIVLNTNKIGRKKLAYEINKNRDGFYVVIDIQLSADKVVELKRYLKLNESVLRYFITVKEAKKAKVA